MGSIHVLEASKNSGRLNKDRHLRMPGTCSSASELKSIASLCLAARSVFFSESKTENDDSLSMRIINFGVTVIIWRQVRIEPG